MSPAESEARFLLRFMKKDWNPVGKTEKEIMGELMQEAFGPLLLAKCGCNHFYADHLIDSLRDGTQMESYTPMFGESKHLPCTSCACNGYEEDNLQWLTNNR